MENVLGGEGKNVPIRPLLSCCLQKLHSSTEKKLATLDVFFAHQLLFYQPIGGWLPSLLVESFLIEF